MPKNPKSINTKKSTAKLYIYSTGQGISANQIHYIAGSNKCIVTDLVKLSNNNYLVFVEFKDYNDLLNLMKTKTTFYNKPVEIRRVFKSMKLRKIWKKDEPRRSFLIEVICGIEGLIKKKTVVRVVGTGEWVKALTQRWQETLDNPEKYKELGINPLVDISKDGDLKFYINQAFDYVITFFDRNIDDLVEVEYVNGISYI